MSEQRIKRMKDLPSTHLLGAGTPMCSGCGGLEALHQIYDVLGEKTVFINAAGCMTLLSVYPFTPFRGSWLYTAMASAPAGAQGVRDALDILLQHGPVSAPFRQPVPENQARIRPLQRKAKQVLVYFS